MAVSIALGRGGKGLSHDAKCRHGFVPVAAFFVPAPTADGVTSSIRQRQAPRRPTPIYRPNFGPLKQSSFERAARSRRR
jgi:hypothetical protein